VLFADLKGSMELLADRDPEEARKILDPVLEHMMEAVQRYEGTVNQVMGNRARRANASCIHCGSGPLGRGFERYANGMTAETPHILMSVSKSLLGLLAGVLAAPR
jgi:CubicO group peptidase (beta-lactamase class C family)